MPPTGRITLGDDFVTKGRKFQKGLGRVLVEMAAGTGKTRSVTAIWCRMQLNAVRLSRFIQTAEDRGGRDN
jgi:hypothetical protein